MITAWPSKDVQSARSAQPQELDEGQAGFPGWRSWVSKDKQHSPSGTLEKGCSRLGEAQRAGCTRHPDWGAGRRGYD